LLLFYFFGFSLLKDPSKRPTVDDILRTNLISNYALEEEKGKSKAPERMEYPQAVFPAQLNPFPLNQHPVNQNWNFPFNQPQLGAVPYQPLNVPIQFQGYQYPVPSSPYIPVDSTQRLLTLEAENANLKQKNFFQQSEISNLKNEVTDLKNKNINLEKRIADMESPYKTAGVDMYGCWLNKKENNKSDERGGRDRREEGGKKGIYCFIISNELKRSMLYAESWK
jgi:hypothetical protein